MDTFQFSPICIFNKDATVYSVLILYLCCCFYSIKALVLCPAQQRAKWLVKC